MPTATGAAHAVARELDEHGEHAVLLAALVGDDERRGARAGRAA